MPIFLSSLNLYGLLAKGLALAKLVVFIYQMTWVLFKQSESEPELDYICEVSRLIN